MPTRLYFHWATNTTPGTFPTTEQSAATANVTNSDATTIRTMDTNISVGFPVASFFNTSASTNARNNFLATYASPPLVGNQSVGGGNMILNVADQEPNLAANFWVNSCCIYVWRPSTGTKVGNIRDAAGTSLGGSEPSAINQLQVTHITGITTSAVNALDGDVIICELWTRTTQSQATSYNVGFQIDGITINTTENAVVTNHASFIEFTENLNFTGTAYNQFDPFGMMGFFGI